MNGRSYDPLAIPQGWLGCPRFGNLQLSLERPDMAPTGLHKLIPMKVPLGVAFNQVIDPRDRFTPQIAYEMLHNAHLPLGMILDLTNTNRYYRPDEWARNQVYHVKISCRGRGQVPDAASVNRAIWEIWTFSSNNPDLYIGVHCTHGFNRTGYVIVCALMRFEAEKGMAVHRALRRFAANRPPGIYKDHYINSLFEYHHETRPESTITPEVPDWKKFDSPERHDHDEPEPGENTDGPKVLKHDDVLGEEIHEDEANLIRGVVWSLVYLEEFHGPGQLRFPGSQPVSLARANMDMIKDRRYWVTWKADGTRYLLFLTHQGVYLIDRKNAVRRVQMRFPTAIHTKPGAPPPAYPVGAPHTSTLLDGEMVVDNISDSRGERQERRYLVYDLIHLNGNPINELPFKERFRRIEEEIIKPRQVERIAIEEGRVSWRYQYLGEPFHVRRKEFWPIYHAPKLIDTLLPALSHESDGLILQGYEDPYKPGTCQELLKWKFASHNSVDFYWGDPRGMQGEPQLCIFKGRGQNIIYVPVDCQIVFWDDPHAEPPVHDPADMIGKIVECAWDRERGGWRYMRVRVDKELPNFHQTYTKVMESIRDDITSEDVLAVLDEAMDCEPYASDRARRAQQGGPPSHSHMGGSSQPPPHLAQAHLPPHSHPPPHSAPPPRPRPQGGQPPPFTGREPPPYTGQLPPSHTGGPPPYTGAPAPARRLPEGQFSNGAPPPDQSYEPSTQGQRDRDSRLPGGASSQGSQEAPGASRWPSGDLSNGPPPAAPRSRQHSADGSTGSARLPPAQPPPAAAPASAQPPPAATSAPAPAASLRLEGALAGRPTALGGRGGAGRGRGRSDDAAAAIPAPAAKRPALGLARQGPAIDSFDASDSDEEGAAGSRGEQEPFPPAKRARHEGGDGRQSPGAGMPSAPEAAAPADSDELLAATAAEQDEGVGPADSDELIADAAAQEEEAEGAEGGLSQPSGDAGGDGDSDAALADAGDEEGGGADGGGAYRASEADEDAGGRASSQDQAGGSDGGGRVGPQGEGEQVEQAWEGGRGTDDDEELNDADFEKEELVDDAE